MKSILIALLALGIASQSFAVTCKDKYQDNLWLAQHRDQALYKHLGVYLGIGGTAGVVGTFMLIGGVAAGFPIGIAGVALIPAGAGVAAIHDISQKTMIKIIDEANEYSAVGGGIPGKNLKKLHSKLSGKVDMTISELAQLIVDGNNDLRLCAGDLPSKKELVKAIEDGTFHTKE